MTMSQGRTENMRLARIIAEAHADPRQTVVFGTVVAVDRGLTGVAYARVNLNGQEVQVPLSRECSRTYIGNTLMILQTNIGNPASRVGVATFNYSPDTDRTKDPWVPLTLQNAWVRFSTTSWNEPGYYKDPYGFVHLHGLIKNGTTTTGVVLTNLPVGFRPWENELRVSASRTSGTSPTTAPLRLDIQSDGNVVAHNELGTIGNTWLNLNVHSWRAER